MKKKVLTGGVILLGILVIIFGRGLWNKYDNPTKMRYISFGSGEKTMVILPGLSTAFVTDNAEGIKAGFSAFTDEYTVYLFDVGEELPDNYTIPQMSEDLVNMINKLGLEDLYIYGCSMGGMEGMYIAGKYPELVEKLVVASSACKANETSNKVIGHWAELAKAGKCLELADLMGQQIYSKAVYEANKEVFQSMGEALDDKMLKRFVSSASSMLDLDITEEAKGITCPVLVLGSREDRILTAEASEEIASITGGEIYLYDSYSHAVYDEAPDFRERVKQFFDSDN